MLNACQSRTPQGNNVEAAAAAVVVVVERARCDVFVAVGSNGLMNCVLEKRSNKFHSRRGENSSRRRRFDLAAERRSLQNNNKVSP